MITISQLLACGIKAARAELFCEPLNDAMVRFRIALPAQKAGFLAQCIHESQGLTKLEEDLFYSDPVRVATIFRTAFDLDKDRVVDPEEIERAKGYVRNPVKLGNIIYANRYGNGNEASGDGYKYRGGGLMHLTFKANYQKASDALGVDYVAQPELVRQPIDAALTAAWFWDDHGCNEVMLGTGGVMRGDEFDQTTREINPGMRGARERKNLFALCCRAVG
jgi:putative chitinase